MTAAHELVVAYAEGAADEKPDRTSLCYACRVVFRSKNVTYQHYGASRHRHGWVGRRYSQRYFHRDVLQSQNSKTAVDNPLLNNAGHGGRSSFIVIDEGELDGSFGFWAENEEALWMHTKIFSTL